MAEVAATLSYDVLLDLPGVVEPMIGRIIALPEHGLPAMNRLTLMAGRWIDLPESNQVLVNQTFADKRGLKPGSTLLALLNGKRERLEVVGIVLSPEYIFPAAHGVGDDASFGIFWIGRKRLAAAFNMEGAFNRVALRLDARRVRGRQRSIGSTVCSSPTARPAPTAATSSRRTRRSRRRLPSSACSGWCCRACSSASPCSC